MKNSLALVIAALGSFASTIVAAGAGDDLVNCTFSNGQPIPPRVCAAMRDSSTRSERLVDRADARRRASLEREADRKAAKAQREAEHAEASRARRAEEAERLRVATAQAEKEEAANQRANAKAAKATAEREATKQAACGADYKNLRVGMTMQRVQECVAPMRMTAQVNQAQGVVSTYQGAGMYAHVIDGKVVAWGK